MGGEQSKTDLIPLPQGFGFMAVTMTSPNKIRLIYPTEEVISLTREVLQQHWPKGIQREKVPVGRAYEFKLKGNPFCKSASEYESVQSIIFTSNLLNVFYNEGWKLLVSSDLSQTIDMSTWVFRKEESGRAQFGFACIDISNADKLMFIGFPPTLRQVFEHVVAQNWPKSIQQINMTGDKLEMKMAGNPWLFQDGEGSIQSKTLIMALINALGKHNWFLYGSGSLKETAETIFFRYDPNAPIDPSRLVGFTISLGSNQCLQIIDANSHVVNCTRDVLQRYWPHGFKREGKIVNANEFQLNVKSWLPDGHDGISARLVMCKLFEALMSIGWRLQYAIDLTRKTNDKTFFAFQQCVPIAAPVFCLSLNYADKIRFINTPHDVAEVLSGAIRNYWPFGIGEEHYVGITKEVKLVGCPWSYGLTGHDGAHGRALLCHLLRLCASLGWSIIASADVSALYTQDVNAPGYLRDIHSLWFMQVSSPPEQVATAPPLPPDHLSPAQTEKSEESQLTFVSGIDDPGYEQPQGPPSYLEIFK